MQLLTKSLRSAFVGQFSQIIPGVYIISLIQKHEVFFSFGKSLHLKSDDFRKIKIVERILKKKLQQ